jgi:hypothetical protein
VGSSGSGLAGTSHLNKSVSFLTAPDHEQGQGQGQQLLGQLEQSTGDWSATNSQLAAADSSTGVGGSAWQKLRSDVSTLTGSKKKFLKGAEPALHTSPKKTPAAFSAEQRKQNLGNRPRPWLMKPRLQLHMEYSWVSQTMLRRAARDVHAGDPQQVAEARREAEARRREERSRKVPALARLSQYNDDDPTVISSLSQLHSFKTKTSLSIRDERCRAQAMQHPYHWL